MDKPTTKDNEVPVSAVHTTTVNRTDCLCRAAKRFFMRLFTGLTRPRASLLGNEFAGVVEAIGSAVTAFEVGDKVFGYNRARSALMPSTCRSPRTLRFRACRRT